MISLSYYEDWAARGRYADLSAPSSLSIPKIVEKVHGLSPDQIDVVAVHWEAASKDWLHCPPEECPWCLSEGESACGRVVQSNAPDEGSEIQRGFCTRARGHDGPHVVCTTKLHNLFQWTTGQ